MHATNVFDRPLAAEGLISYRLKGRSGWVMIGASDHDDAMREAARSTANPLRSDLQVWSAGRSSYVAAI